MPGVTEMSVASLTSQRNVADCPRSMVLGSAEKEMAGAFGGGGTSFTSGFGGGGGGGGGAFFLQPAATINRDTASSATLMFRLLILNLASWSSKPQSYSTSIWPTPAWYCALE
jgi:hypothetical protein